MILLLRLLVIHVCVSSAGILYIIVVSDITYVSYNMCI